MLPEKADQVPLLPVVGLHNEQDGSALQAFSVKPRIGRGKAGGKEGLLEPARRSDPGQGTAEVPGGKDGAKLGEPAAGQASGQETGESRCCS